MGVRVLVISIIPYFFGGVSMHGGNNSVNGLVVVVVVSCFRFLGLADELDCCAFKYICDLIIGLFAGGDW